MLKDYSYDYEWDAEYCYPQSNVLINKLNITDCEKLFVAEREITALRIAKAKDTPIKGSMDLKHLKKIHSYVFSDIYTWAGKLRHVNISKGNQFCLCMHLEQYAANIFYKLKEENYLITENKSDIPQKLAYYLSEINVLHPFREGNGRAQRLFIEYLAGFAGFDVNFSAVSDKEMIEASVHSFACDYDQMNTLFERISTEISPDEQEQNIIRFFGKQSEILQLFLKIQNENQNSNIK